MSKKPQNETPETAVVETPETPETPEVSVDERISRYATADRSDMIDLMADFDYQDETSSNEENQAKRDTIEAIASVLVDEIVDEFELGQLVHAIYIHGQCRAKFGGETADDVVASLVKPRDRQMIREWVSDATNAWNRFNQKRSRKPKSYADVGQVVLNLVEKDLVTYVSCIEFGVPIDQPKVEISKDTANKIEKFGTRAIDRIREKCEWYKTATKLTRTLRFSRNENARRKLRAKLV